MKPSSNFWLCLTAFVAALTCKLSPAAAQLQTEFREPRGGGGAGGGSEACDYQYDDGTRESALSLSGSGELCWIHQYQVIPEQERIVSVSTSWEDVANGRPARVFVWEDPDDDGNPINAVLLVQQAVTVQNTNTGIVNEYVLDAPPIVSGRFFVGAAVQQLPGELPCPVDTSSLYVAARTWFVGDFQAFNPVSLAGNDVPPTDAADVGAGYAILRACGAAGPQMTYQGRLASGGQVVDGPADLRFALFDELAAGTQIGDTVDRTGVNVAAGLFTVQLPFGAASFSGAARYMEISVAVPPGSAFVPLSPRQFIADAPYAAFARSVAWPSILGMPAGFVDGVDDAGTGDITGVTAGPGLTGGGTAGAVTVAANFGGNGTATSLSRSDHFHSSLDASDGSPADVVFSDSLGNVGVGTLTPARRLHVANGVSGAASQSTTDFVIEDDAAAFQHFITPDDIESGLLFGDVTASIGGGIIFNNAATNNGMQFRAGGNTTRMTLDGTGRLGIGITPTATLHVGGVGGDDSVKLPNEAINSVEMFDEPGVASDVEGVIATALSPSIQPIRTRAIDVPAPGFVLVIGSCQATANHVNGTASSANFGVSDTTSFPASQDVGVSLPSGAATGGYNWAVTVHGLFEVTTAGSHTFRMLAEENGAEWSASELQLTLVYFPTSYGTVDPTIIGGPGDDDLEPTFDSATESAPDVGLSADEGPAAAVDLEAALLRLEQEREQVRLELEALRRLKEELSDLKEELRATTGD
ncbi:MAG TPA: hypothetical protein VNT79_04545 [Phycisphaerae bacterium]|nr:hypothetical protein [Phycisphaerae bacterium]